MSNDSLTISNLISPPSTLSSKLSAPVPILTSTNETSFSNFDLPAAESALESILAAHHTIFEERIGQCNKYVHRFNVDTNMPIREKCYPITRQKGQAVSTIIEDWINEGILVDSEAIHRVPLVPIMKKDGSYRVCCDFRELNKHLHPQNHKPARIESLKTKLGGSRWFSELDFRQGFLQVPLAKESQDYCTIMHKGRPLKFTRVSFGSNDSMAAFIAALQRVLVECDDFIVTYVDDVLIHSATLEEHLEHINRVLTAIEDSEMTLTKPKCRWLQKQVPFLGLIVDKYGTSPDPDNVRGILEYPECKSKKDIQSWMGSINFY